jgi:uncharacterized membrane protein YfcA
VILVLGLALGIGLLLGLLGGGGSVLMVPMLVYVAGLDPKEAIGTSLLVVAVTSLVAMLGHARHGRVCWKTGLVFATSGMVGAYGGGRGAAYLPGGVLLLLFAGVMLATAVAMLRGRNEGAAQTGKERLCPREVPALAILFDGLLVGGLTGLVGAGGGFLVVPALNLLGGLAMHAAVGTSLFVITLNSCAALFAYFSHALIRLELALPVAAAAVVGSLLGGVAAARVRGASLRRGFGAFVALIGGFLLYRELTPAMLAEIYRLFLAHPDFFRGAATVLLVLLLYRVGVWVHGRHSSPGGPFGERPK